MILKTWGFLVVQLCVQYSVQQINWCDPKYKCGGVNHTMCIYKEEAAILSGSCSGMVDAMGNETRQRILGMHNYVRNYIAAGYVPGWPEASNMRQLTWDDTSEKVARRWAFQCINTRDQCRITPEFKNIGQNFGTASGEKGSLDGVFLIFKGWLDQIVLTSGSNVKSFKYDPKYDLFAAIIWAETYKIGCGLVNLSYAGSSFDEFRQALICNYAPAGNTDGKPMWTEGDRCSNCPKGTECYENSTYRHLCAFPGDSSIEQPIPIDIPSCESRAFDFKSTILLVSLVIFKTYEIAPSYVPDRHVKRV